MFLGLWYIVKSKEPKKEAHEDMLREVDIVQSDSVMQVHSECAWFARVDAFGGET